MDTSPGRSRRLAWPSLVLACILLLVACGPETPPADSAQVEGVVVTRHRHSPQPEELIASNPGLALVRAFDFASPNAFADICFAEAKADPMFAQLVGKLGSEQAAAEQLRALVVIHAEDYDELWEHHYAFAFAELLSRAELESLAREGLASPHRARLDEVKVEVLRRSLSYMGNMHKSIAGGAVAWLVHGLPPGPTR